MPLRVAGACLPFLEGNAYGFQVELQTTLRGRAYPSELALSDEDAARMRALHGTALSLLVARGLLARDGYWHHLLRNGPFWSEQDEGTSGTVFSMWTGLLIRPGEGVLLRVSSCANRRNTLFDVDEYLIAERSSFTPLLLRLRAEAQAFALSGEVACVGPLGASSSWEERVLTECRALGRQHAEFFDQSYFDRKRLKSTRKYRARAVKQSSPSSNGDTRCRMVKAGPCQVGIEVLRDFLGPEGPATLPGGASFAEFRNQISFAVHFDGYSVSLSYDKGALAGQAKALVSLWSGVYGEAFLDQHRSALGYLTRYFTSHPKGEPHFFVKPWAFFETPPGWSSLLEGAHGAGYDVLRGVVSTDWFGATPAVFHLRSLGRSLEILEGTPLLRIFAVPRELLQAGFEQVRWEH